MFPLALRPSLHGTKMVVPQGQPGEGRTNTTQQGTLRGVVRNEPADSQGRGGGGQAVPQAPKQRCSCSL